MLTLDRLYQGDAQERLSWVSDCSIDALVTDPPSGLAFMSRDWDRDKGGRQAWIAWLASILRESLRVLKPGAHALVWALPKTSHWTATALEDAGFEIRDIITHISSKTFPKGQNISLAIDKLQGNQRPVIGTRVLKGNAAVSTKDKRGTFIAGASMTGVKEIEVTRAGSADSAAWEDWKTGLKPIAEYWILARKPISEESIAGNVLKWRTGGLNIGATRIPAPGEELGRPNTKGPYTSPRTWNTSKTPGRDLRGQDQGRWPANLTFAHGEDCQEGACSPDCPLRALDEQAGLPVSRFFYQAKANKEERDAGCQDLYWQRSPERPSGWLPISRAAWEVLEPLQRAKGNTHATVKPLGLCSWLLRLITPPGGTVLDPFAGSCSIPVAALREGFHFLAFEQDEDYIRIGEARIEHEQELAAPLVQRELFEEAA